MAQTIEKTGKTVQDAIGVALEEFQVDVERVDVEVLDEGTKGIFGILGNKQARVRVTLKETKSDVVRNFLLSVFEKMNVSVNIDCSEDAESVLAQVTGDDSGIIIGRRGETLDSLQYLTSLVLNRSSEEYIRVTVDIENYRQKREETLIKLANKLAERVIKYRKKLTLEPMNPYERRIIHSTLQNNRMVETYSVGDEPNRKVVIGIKQARNARFEQRRMPNKEQ
jgi:spoIIIJ-associated protein